MAYNINVVHLKNIIPYGRPPGLVESSAYTLAYIWQPFHLQCRSKRSSSDLCNNLSTAAVVELLFHSINKTIFIMEEIKVIEKRTCRSLEVGILGLRECTHLTRGEDVVAGGIVRAQREREAAEK